MIDPNFTVYIEEEKYGEDGRNIALGIKSNENAHRTFLPLLTREELVTVAATIIRYLSQKKEE